MTLAERWKQEGRREGLEEGRQEGRQEGRREGLEEGRQEGLEEGTEKVARNLLNLGLELTTIQQATGLAYELLQNMRNSLNPRPHS